MQQHLMTILGRVREKDFQKAFKKLYNLPQAYIPYKLKVDIFHQST